MDSFNRNWITENALDIIHSYSKGILTLRALHYRLVSRGMTNTARHYKRVIGAMTKARWNGLVDFDTFSDNDRQVLGNTAYEKTNLNEKISEAQSQIELWMKSYYKNMWENQNYYIEVWIEKKALQGVFRPICSRYNVALAPCKGYPSLTFLDDAATRFADSYETHENVILYFGDYDPSGEDIPRAIQENLERMGAVVDVDRILLKEDQVIEMNLPPAPVKRGDSRTANWDGLGQVELDAIEPQTLQEIAKNAILKYRDADDYNELLRIEEAEQDEFKAQMKDFVLNWGQNE